MNMQSELPTRSQNESILLETDEILSSYFREAEFQGASTHANSIESADRSPSGNCQRKMLLVSVLP